MVMLTRDGKYICGAALVNRPPNHHQADSTGSSDILLTAAHCLVQHGENLYGYCTNRNLVKVDIFQKLEDVRFMNVISFLATNWIVEAFENIDVPNIWLNRLSEYWPNSANSVHEEYLQTTEEVLNNFYFGLPEGYNRELTLPQYSSTDYVQLWVEKRIYDHIYDVEHMAADIQDLIGYIKQSDPYKCAIDCFMWNGNRPCFFMFDNRRCFFSAKKYANRLGDFGLSMLRIRMKGEHEAEPGLIKDFNFKTVEKKSAIPKHWNARSWASFCFHWVLLHGVNQ
uniref:Peptidase S1 domain-containing protein n=1 Tax=Romanomermis culicivorax TaxID=13658 RepID=A0A915I3T8_ROMCU